MHGVSSRKIRAAGQRALPWGLGSGSGVGGADGAHMPRPKSPPRMMKSSSMKTTRSRKSASVRLRFSSCSTRSAVSTLLHLSRAT